MVTADELKLNKSSFKTHGHGQKVLFLGLQLMIILIIDQSAHYLLNKLSCMVKKAVYVSIKETEIRETLTFLTKK